MPVRRTIALYEDGGLGLYPINAARNAALRLATTELVLLLDVDFLPSTGLHSTVAGSAAELRRRCVEERRLLVLPAFESCADACEAAALAAGGKPALAAAVVGPTPVTDFLVSKLFGRAVGGRVRLFISGGGPLNRSTHDYVRALFPAVSMVQGYTHVSQLFFKTGCYELAPH